jgi:hypothetical protein
MRSELDHHLDSLAVVHRTIAIGDTVDARNAIEHQTGLDATVQYVGHQFVHVGTNRRRAAGDGEVVVERWLRARDRRLLRHADAADGTAARAMPTAVRIDSPCPTHLRTEWAPSPPVSSRTRSIAASPRSLTPSVAPSADRLDDANELVARPVAGGARRHRGVAGGDYTAHYFDGHPQRFPPSVSDGPGPRTP